MIKGRLSSKMEKATCTIKQPLTRVAVRSYTNYYILSLYTIPPLITAHFTHSTTYQWV